MCLDKLNIRLNKIEKELEKVRGCSPLTDGWQTQKLANKQRKWDVLAQERMRITNEIYEIKNKTP